MGVQLNIKSEEARRLAEELAAESGETLTPAVTEAMRERLKALRRERSQTPSAIEERQRILNDVVKLNFGDCSATRWPRPRTRRSSSKGMISP
ncbi:type II toxin-antitoxin system VapB family antitoxin [Sphingomonas sp.]|jgi:hypothetical protein|uniref:type II toxin-antitoxin system VapB family antitoxin n=1 Tax=Sphingomonas sp. TaxID=28214 RepID=UPI002E3369EB|nr:type II toxin-antitoxin system VapB family antitoxin [Sphingomonas sp.]HEX4695870.1 type II toxin-antitoxin system VapB family antitoxin [Sphingomonas sp.]